MADDKTHLLAGEKPTTVGDSDALYHDSSQTPTIKRLQIAFVSFISAMVLISLSLSIYHGIEKGENGALYFMLALSLLGFVFIEICMIIFIRRGELPKGKQWFLYLVGCCILLEAIFTDILVFQ